MWTIYWCAVSSTSKCLEYASILQYSRNRFQKQCWTHRGWWFGQLTCWKVKENLKDQIKVSALGSQEVWLACAWLPQQSWGPFLNVRILPNLRNIDNLYHSTKNVQSYMVQTNCLLRVHQDKAKAEGVGCWQWPQSPWGEMEFFIIGDLYIWSVMYSCRGAVETSWWWLLPRLLW